MYRKNRPNDYIEPMSKKQLQKIIRAFKKNGGLIIMSEETDKYLAKKKGGRGNIKRINYFVMSKSKQSFCI